MNDDHECDAHVYNHIYHLPRFRTQDRRKPIVVVPKREVEVVSSFKYWGMVTLVWALGLAFAFMLVYAYSQHKFIEHLLCEADDMPPAKEVPYGAAGTKYY